MIDQLLMCLQSSVSREETHHVPTRVIKIARKGKNKLLFRVQAYIGKFFNCFFPSKFSECRDHIPGGWMVQPGKNSPLPMVRYA